MVTLAEAAERAREVADQVLFPAAQDTDRAALVPRSNLEALGDAGLHGLFGPAAFEGGLAADAPAARPVVEAVAGACGATAFVWAQHNGAVRRLAGGSGPGRDRWLAACCRGEALAGIGFAYLRRPGPATVRATPLRGGGWRIDGEAPWITGWGLVDVLVILARVEEEAATTEAPADTVVSVLVDRLDRASIRPEAPQRLAVMGATGTVALGFDGLEVSPDDVIDVADARGWSRRERLGSLLPAPAPLGVADRAIRLLEPLAERQPAVAEARDALARELTERRRIADAIAERSVRVVAQPASDDDDALVAEGSAERARGLDLARRATDVLVASTGGGAMDLAHPAQRLSREATFYLIQAQTAELRVRTLRTLTARG